MRYAAQRHALEPRVTIESLICEDSAKANRGPVLFLSGPYSMCMRYGSILGIRSFVVYQTDRESLDVGWRLTMMVLSETV